MLQIWKSSNWIGRLAGIPALVISFLFTAIIFIWCAGLAIHMIDEHTNYSISRLVHLLF
jgi:hypothetical protein